MQISLAMRMASMARSLALSFECFTSARAAESAKVPPEPMATRPSSGSMTSPFPGQLDRGFLEIAGKLLKLAFEAFKKRNCVGRGAGETGDDLVIIKAARFARGVLHDVIAHGHLAIGDEHDLVVLAYAQNCGAVHLWAFPGITHPLIIAPEESERQNGRSVGSSSGRTLREQEAAS